MKHSLWLASIAIFFAHFAICRQQFVIVIPSYNNETVCEANIKSALEQDWPEEDFQIIYIDDCSADNTYQKVCDFCKSHPKGDLATIIRNESRRGTMENQYYAIHSVEPHKVIIILDGDDFLAGPHVLQRVAQEYDKGAWLTYGQCLRWPFGDSVFAAELPDHLHESRKYRQLHGTRMTHLRTFYAGLFQLIKKEDLLVDGEFYVMACDIATMYPMVEMAGRRAVFIPDVLYLYNDINPINDHKKDLGLQQRLDLYARSQKPYELLENLEFLETTANTPHSKKTCKN